VTTAADDDVWEAQDTNPSAIEAALRELLAARHQRHGTVVPARSLNLVVVVDRRFRGEVENRLDKIGRFLPSRVVICAVDARRRSLDARAVMATREAGDLAVARERIELDVGERHLASLETIVDPLVVPDLATLVWCPHGHHEAEHALREMAQVVLVDAIDQEVDEALDRINTLQRDLYVVDLAWLRSTPWRERTAAAFDAPQYRANLRSVASVTVRHRHDSVAPAALYVGWLASKLGWTTSRLISRGGDLVGSAKTRRHEVKITLQAVEQEIAPGLAGVTIEDASGASVSLDRAPGGLLEKRVGKKGDEREFQVLGASRGEGGILGEGVRQALLRDGNYEPAVGAARAMVSR
jgi:glucose-6-phosphate dehydrogenase assembly protein OpcA